MGDLALILEAVMIALFGFSWPNNIMKTLQNKSTKGKSLMFLILIDTGYVAGVASKFITLASAISAGESKPWIFYLGLAVYILNFVMVSTDLILYFYFAAKEKKQLNK